MYVKDIKTGICAKDGEPVVEKESAATALVDGRNLLGPVVGNFCMKLAIQKAKEVGIGWVVAHGGSWTSWSSWSSGTSWSSWSSSTACDQMVGSGTTR